MYERHHRGGWRDLAGAALLVGGTLSGLSAVQAEPAPLVPPGTPPAATATTAAPAEPAADPLATVVTLRQTLGAELEALLRRWVELQPLAASVGQAEAGMSRAAIDFSKISAGLQSCFAAVDAGGCSAPATRDLRSYATSLEPRLQQPLLTRLAELDTLRTGLSDVVVRSRLLIERATKARQEAERLTERAYRQARETDENPLEAAPLKARHVARWKQAQQERDQLAALALRIDQEVRPLEGQVTLTRVRVLEQLSRFGSADR